MAMACSSSSNGGPPEHVSQDGSFGFDGDGWVRDTTTSNDVWRKGDAKIVLELGTSTFADSRTWAESDVLDGVPILLQPTAIGSSGAYWFGWHADDGLDVYEWYFIGGGHRIHAEMSAATLSQADAEASLSTVRPL